ncbi:MULTISPECIES: cytochrome c oxidase subunit 3 [Brevundimonas]|jgi:cytochrome c oxidase subunit 3|uniref:cytochrome c oxidase subunit 3 n=1 Tax=Brevundimonas TaxID=41275 RepID=UPI000409FB60|nr:MULTISPECIES: cytochrome c oxidase subunit 3 [Brevundimonas]RIJ65589.1 cytochrome c oxidase subunit 3 [Brevundimonas sp. LPMIX5]
MADAHAKPQHDYHLVDPSPWPLVGSFSACVMFVGAVVWMKGLFGLEAGTKWMFFVGLAGVLFTMFSWWSDVVKESRKGDHTPVVGIGLRYGMVLFIASEVMFFVSFFWMFFDMAIFNESRAIIPEVGNWMDTAAAWKTWPPTGVELLDPWSLPLMNTVILLLSGTTLTWAHHAIIVGDRKAAKMGLLITVLLGLLFTGVQAYEYYHILHGHLFFSEDAAQAKLYGSIFFMTTGFHGFHVAVGTIFLAVCLLRLQAGQMSPQKHFGLEAAAWYWHFVDVVWLFLFVFMYVVFG